MPAILVTVAGLLGAVATRPMLAWAENVYADHDHFPYTPFHWASNVLTVLNANVWAPFVCLGALVGIGALACLTRFFRDATFTEVIMATTALAICFVAALPMLLSVFMLLLCGLLVVLVYILIAIAILAVIGLVLWAWASNA